MKLFLETSLYPYCSRLFFVNIDYTFDYFIKSNGEIRHFGFESNIKERNAL